MAVNQAGRHVELSIAPFAGPRSVRRSVKFYAGDLDDQGRFLSVNKENSNERMFMRSRGDELELVSTDGAPFGVARRIELRSTLFPVAVRSISRSLDRATHPAASPVGQVVDVAEQFLTTAQIGPFLYRQEHAPLSQSQIAFLSERFTSAEFTNLIRRAAAAKGFRSADAGEREDRRAEIER